MNLLGDTSFSESKKKSIIGILNFFCYRDPQRYHRGTLGISLRHDYRGKGIGMHMMLTLLDKAKTIVNLKRIELNVMAPNAPAIKLYESVGFKEISRTPDAFKLDNGEFVDDILMAFSLE